MGIGSFDAFSADRSGVPRAQLVDEYTQVLARDRASAAVTGLTIMIVPDQTDIAKLQGKQGEQVSV